MDFKEILCVLGLSTLWVWLADGAATTGTKCYKNEEIGEYPENIYYCEDTAKPECCEKDATFTCCETKSKSIAKEQIILWGCVFGAVGCITFVWICYRKDTYLCEGAPLSQRCSCCDSKEKMKDDQLSDIEYKSDTSYKRFTSNQKRPTTPSGGVTARGIQPIFVAEAKPEVGQMAVSSEDQRPSYTGDPPDGAPLSPEPDLGPDYPGYEPPENYDHYPDGYPMNGYAGNDGADDNYFDGYPMNGYAGNDGADDNYFGYEDETAFNDQEPYNPALNDSIHESQPPNALPPIATEEKRPSKKKDKGKKKGKKKDTSRNDDDGLLEVDS